VREGGSSFYYYIAEILTKKLYNKYKEKIASG